MAMEPDQPAKPDGDVSAALGEQPGQQSPELDAARAQAQASLTAIVDADPNLETATVTLSKDALDFLRDEAKKRGVTTGDMLRISIGTQKFLAEKTAAGAKVQLKGPDGTFDVAI